jgi:hypothetical protein
VPLTSGHLTQDLGPAWTLWNFFPGGQWLLLPVHLEGVGEIGMTKTSCVKSRLHRTDVRYQSGTPRHRVWAYIALEVCGHTCGCPVLGAVQ